MFSPKSQRAALVVRLGYYVAAALAVIFLAVSILTWSMLLGACSLILAVLLFRNLDVVVEEIEGNSR